MTIHILCGKLFLMKVKDILNKLKELKARISKGENKLKRVHVKGLGVIIVNADGTHADVSKWK